MKRPLSPWVSGAALLIFLLRGGDQVFPQALAPNPPGGAEAILVGIAPGQLQSSVKLYIDSVNGLMVEDLVQRALSQNGELLAAREQVRAALGGLTQAGLRPNPTIAVTGLNQLNGPDNNISVGGSLPLELFGRRQRRVEVARRESEVMQQELAERERQLAAAVRSKYGDAVAALRNLRFSEELLNLNRENFRLISARVQKGATAPLEDGIQQVEVNRIDTLRTEYESRLEVILLELRTLAGMRPEEPLQFRSEFEAASIGLTQEAALEKALAERPDVRAAQLAEELALAQLRQAQTEGLPDASLVANYQRTDFGFDVNGLTAAGDLRRVQGIFHDFSYGVSLSLPLRNKNQGNVQAAAARLAAARHQREFAELVARREVAAAYLRHEKARQRLTI